MAMSFLDSFVILCSIFVGVRHDKPGHRVNEPGLINSDLGTEVNKGNEEESISFSSGDELIRRRAAICGSNAPANYSLSTQGLSSDRTLAFRGVYPIL
jgi:hypothetical protein